MLSQRREMKALKVIPQKTGAVTMPWSACFSLLPFLLLALALGAHNSEAASLISSPTTPYIPSSTAGGDSSLGDMTPDARYVLFASTANNLTIANGSNLVSNYYPPKMNVFRRDRLNNETALVSATSLGIGGNGDSFASEISTNGQLALFESFASDLLAGDTNGAADIFLRDMGNNQTILVNPSTNGGFANGESHSAVMSPDGRYVAFVSLANNLVAGDTNGIPDVFVRDVLANVTYWASTGASRVTANTPWLGSSLPALTPDGRYVAFFSTATNLVPGVRRTNEIYVRDLVANITHLASTNARSLLLSTLGSSNAISYNHAISADGRYVAFESGIKSGPTAPANYTGIILRHDLQTGLTDLIHTNALGLPASAHLGYFEEASNLTLSSDGRYLAFIANTNGTLGYNQCVLQWDAQTGLNTLISVTLSNTTPTNATCSVPVMDDTGRYVAFFSTATNLVTNTIAGEHHLYVRDVLTETTRLASAGTNGMGNQHGIMSKPQLSQDARFLLFDSPAENLITDDDNAASDVFIRDLMTDEVELISVRAPELASKSLSGHSIKFSISPNARFIAFASEASRFVANDTNGCRDVFLQDLQTGLITLASINSNGISPGMGNSSDPAVSADGRYVAFSSWAEDLVVGDTNRNQDIFVRDTQTGATRLVSMTTNLISSANGDSDSPQISNDGRFVILRSRASNLAPGTFTSGLANYFLADLQFNSITALTTNGTVGASMTPDGRFVATAAATPSSAIRVWDTQTKSTIWTNTNNISPITLVSISPNGQRVAYASFSQLCSSDRSTGLTWTITSSGATSLYGLRFSGDGRFLVFATRTAILPADSNVSSDVYLHDFDSQQNLLISRTANNVTASGFSDSPDISADGRFITFRNSATNLVSGNTNSFPNIYLYDRINDLVSLLTTDADGNPYANNRSLAPMFSRDGRSLVFLSWAQNLAAKDFNQSCDLFAVNFLYAGLETTASTGPRSIRWLATPGQSYRVEYKNVLSDSLWQELAGPITITGNQAEVLDSTPHTDQRYYRVVSY